MGIRDLFNTPKYEHWTPGAIECHQRGGMCKGCETYEILGDKCKMKYAVISLMRENPLPEEANTAKNIIENIEKKEVKMTKLSNDLTETEKEILDLLLQGLNYSQIAEKESKTLNTIRTFVNSIFSKRNYHSLQELLVKELTKRQNTPETDKDTFELLQKENQELKAQIEEFTKTPKVALDFDKVRAKIQNEINRLTAKLEAINMLETELRGVEC